ncbi:MAG: hypothetical protein K0R55_2728 [Sporomusa sp.]|jgi:ABC-2 type transport system permease protein|nr:hypothetical protein [Sporomusa sp.]
MTWWRIGLQELIHIIKNYPKLIVIIFIAPFLYLNLYGVLFANHSVDGIPLIVYDESQTQLSRKLVQAFEDSERFSVVAYVDSQEQMQEYLREKKADAALLIPANFARDINTGMSTSVLMESSGSNLLVTNMVITVSQEIIGDFSKERGVSLLSTAGYLPGQADGKISPVKLQTRILYNPLLSYQSYFVFGLVMISFHTALLICSSGSMLMEYKMGKFKNSSALHVLAGKLLPFWVAGLCAYSVLLALAVAIFDLPFRGNVLELLVLGAAFVFAITSLGSFVISFFQSMLSFYQLVISCTVLIFTISGTTWPLASMPFAVQCLASLFPFTFLANNVRNLMLSGHTVHLYRDVIVLLSYGIITFTLGLYRFKKSRLSTQ